MKEIDFRYDLLPLKDRLFRLALRITLDRLEAEDITEETLIRVWQRRGELQEVQSLEAYCLTICRNLAIDRASRKETSNISLEEADIDTPDSTPAPDEQMEHNERLRQVHEAFNRLPTKLRTALQLRDIEGYAYSDVAHIMEISEADVKVSIHRARQAVKRMLGPEH